MTGPGDDDPTTEELRVVQGHREEAARRAAQSADTDAEAEKEGRRAEKSAYLRQKLEEREEAERRARES